MKIISFIADLVTALSIIGTIIVIYLTKKQIDKNTKAIISKNHLELRKLFSEPSRFEVHSKLRPGNNNADVEEWPANKNDWVEVEDYLGVFETIEFMLKSKTLDENMVKSTYYYRLVNIKHNSRIVDKIMSPDEDWELMKGLLRRYALLD